MIAAAPSETEVTSLFLIVTALFLAGCLVLFVLAWLRGWQVVPAVAVAVTLVTRVVTVALANGHTPGDVTNYFDLAGQLVSEGRDPLTQQPAFQWNFLPLMPYVFALEQHLGLSWQLASKIVPVLADLVTTVLLGRLATGADARRVPLLYALCPVAILVTGWHGQVEPVALALGLGGLLLARRHRAVGSGLLLGLAVATKTWPVLLVLGPLRETPVRRWWRLLLPAGAALVALLATIPMFLHDSLRAAVPVLANYRSYTGTWGWSGILHYYGRIGGGYAGPGVEKVQHVGTVLTLVAVAAVVAVFWRDGAVPLTAAVLLAFLIVTSGFGQQYLLWPVPFVLLLRRRTGLVFLVLASLYAVLAYEPQRPQAISDLMPWASLPVIAAAALALPWSLARRPAPARV
jgi:Glycosyltransferase family 87